MKFPATVYKHDNWGNLYYNFAKKPGSFVQEPALVDGKSVLVTFKSGKKLLYKIVGKTIRVTINDMGHSYEVTTTELGININFEGHIIFLPLEGLKVTLL